MKKHLHFLLFTFFVLLLHPAIAQTPPSGAPSNIDALGPILPRAITNNASFEWSIVNNTDCEATFINWFRINVYASEGDYMEGLIEEVIFKETSGSNTPIVLPGGNAGGVTNAALMAIWGLSPGKYYTIDANGVYLAFGNMTSFMEIYPAGSGTKVSTGQDSPCDCFRYFFEPTANGFRLRLEPVLAPETCP